MLTVLPTDAPPFVRTMLTVLLVTGTPLGPVIGGFLRFGMAVGENWYHGYQQSTVSIHIDLNQLDIILIKC